MKKLFITILLLLAANSYASQKAITDTGEEVILNSDGKWEYSVSAQKATDTIKTDKKKFARSKDSLFQLKSIKNNSAYWINTDKWSFGKAKNNTQAEFGMTDIGCYLVIIFTKRGKLLRVISARDMNRKESRFYEKNG